MKREDFREGWLWSSHLVLLFLSLLFVCATQRAAAAVTGRWEAPLYSLAGARAPLRLTFHDDSGALISQKVAFQLAVTGKARFESTSRAGKIIGGGGSPFINAETDGGVFEIDVDTPLAEEIDFNFEETSRLGVESMLQCLFFDGVEAGRPRWSGRTLGGPIEEWAVKDAPGDADGPREGTKAWWSGFQAPSQDSALISIPFRVPLRGKTLLQLFQRFQLEREECVAAGKAHHGARVEWEAEPGGRWEALQPTTGYPFTIQSSCMNSLEGEMAFGGSTQGRFQKAVFDLKPLAGKKVRLRFRLATGCETCDPFEGWLLDDFRVDTTELKMRVLDPLSDDDKDGISNQAEVERGTDPQAADSDGDCLLDRSEDSSGIFLGADNAGSDPLSPDTDGGGVPDGIEALLGNDPNSAGNESSREGLPLRIPAGPAGYWVIRGDGSAGPAAENPLEEVFTGNGGFHLLVEAQAFPPLAEVYHSSGDKYLLGPEALGPLCVTRRILASPNGPFLRYLDTFENISSKNVNETVTLECEFAQKRWVEVEEASSGASVWKASDDHVHFNDRDPVGGMPYLLWLYSGPAAPVEPQAVRLDGGIARIGFPLSLEPNERKAILYFAAQGLSLDDSRSKAKYIAENDREAGAGLGLEDEKAIINLTLDRDGDGIPGLFEISRGLDPENPADAALDPDQDGLTNLEEFQYSTDPHNPDTDGDGITDGREVKELKTNPASPDSDSDGVNDGEDPFPRSALIAEFSEERYRLVGQAAAVTINIRQDEQPFTERLRFSLLIDSPEAVFVEPAQGGQVLQGLGTSRILVEVEGGSFQTAVRASSAGRRFVSLLDSERQGVKAPSSVLEDFEANDGRFVSEGSFKAWEWGEPPGRPGAFSGRKVWGTGLSGSYPPLALDALTTPEYKLSADGAPFLEVQSFLEVMLPFDFAQVFISSNGGEYSPLGEPLQNTIGKYERLSFNLKPYLGKKVRFQFIFRAFNDTPALGWFLDDFHVSGLKSSAYIDFLNEGDDPDRDGLDNKTEIERGTNPTSADTDSDGLADGVETGTGVFVDARNTGSQPTNPDTDGGGEGDGAEVKASRNPNDPFDDQVAVDLSSPLSFIDGEERQWFGTPLGSVFSVSDQANLFLNELQVASSPFFGFEGILTFQKQMLILTDDSFGNTAVTRKVFVSRKEPMVRWLEIVRNTENREALVAASLASAFTPFEIVTTGNGDKTFDPDDEFLVLRLETGKESLYFGQYIRSPQALLKPASATLENGLEGLFYSLRVPPRGRVALLHFVTVSNELSVVEDILQRLKKSDPALLLGLKDDDLSLVANYWIDSDADGLPDAYERKNGLDPMNPADAAEDKDGDGLSNMAEYQIGTDPRKADTDGDGLTDGDEIQKGVDPLKPDTDGDGIPDGSDSLPLFKLVARGRELTLGIAGRETRVRLHLELSSREGLPPSLDLGPLLLGLRFSKALEVVKVAAGEQVGVEGADTYIFHPRRDWLILDVRSPDPGQVDLTIEDRSGFGVSGQPGSLRFLSAEGDEDGDGLPNAFEVDRGTDPFSADTDQDGFQDRYETGSLAVFPGIDFGTFPWTADSDGGGSPDQNEILEGKDPFRAEDDLKEVPLPAALGSGADRWVVLPSWALTGPPETPSRIDNAGTLRVNERPLPFQLKCLAASGGAMVRLGPVNHAGLQVSRSMYAFANGRFLRFVETLFNPGPDPVQATVELRFDLAGDSRSAVDATSSGNAALGRDDRWVLFRDNRQRLLHVFFGGQTLKEVFVQDGDLLREVFVFDVPPRESRTLVHFLATGPQGAQLRALAGTLLDLRGGALEGISTGSLQAAVNLPRLSPLLWDRFPRSAVAPRELWSLEGEFLPSDIEVLVGGKPLEKVAAFPRRIVLRAPETPGEAPLEVKPAGGEPLVFEEKLVVAFRPDDFRRGDFDENGEVNLADALGILRNLFQGGEPARCPDSADIDDNGKIDLSDAVSILRALFQGTGMIPYPGGAVPGPDPTPDELRC